MTFVDLQENDQVLFVSTVSHTGLFCFYHSQCGDNYYVLVSYLCSLFKNQKGNRYGFFTTNKKIYPELIQQQIR
jgi:hypothetical protein